MVTFILLALVASLPIIAYLLANQTSSKGIILGITVIVLSLCLIFFISKFSILGTFEKQSINNKIIDEIYLDKKISIENLVNIENTLKEDEIKIWLISLVSKSIELNKLNSAESLVTFSEKFFNSNEEKLIFYNMYTTLRDAKFPAFADANFFISDDSLYPCNSFKGEIKIYIMNGPEIPIGEQKFDNFDAISISNDNSIIPGFDLASAFLNTETVELNVSIECDKKESNFYLKNLIVLDQNKPSVTYKIGLNEWFKRPQEL
tara:strand:+ start:302 stop:1087 length:786 start_codon:yes stop_codon:yes gene_type:complete